MGGGKRRDRKGGKMYCKITVATLDGLGKRQKKKSCIYLMLACTEKKKLEIAFGRMFMLLKEH